MTISSLGYIVVDSTDLSKWETFGRDVLGMMLVDAPDSDTLWLQMDERPFRIAVRKAETDRLGYSGWEVADKATFDATIEKIKALDLPIEQASKAEAKDRCAVELIRSEDPCGNKFELYYGRIYDYRQFISPKGVSGFVTGNMGMGHVVLPCPDLATAFKFYTETLGFGLTDEMSFAMSPNPDDPELGLYFLHADNPRHHSLALFQAENPAGCIHVMVEVHDMDDVGFAIDRCNQTETPIASTLGRHTNDEMISFYIHTPAGFAFEYGFDGWQVDWSDYQPTKSLLPSHWGHKWG